MIEVFVTIHIYTFFFYDSSLNVYGVQATSSTEIINHTIALSCPANSFKDMDTPLFIQYCKHSNRIDRLISKTHPWMLFDYFLK